MLNFFAHHSLIEGDYNLKDIKVMDEIGRGNSHVYIAMINNQLYAIKQIEIKSDYEYQSFLKEITYMKEISEICQDMIQYYGYFVTMLEINQYSKRKYAYIVMQCAEMNLQNLITCRAADGKRFSKAEIIKITDFLLNAFTHLQKNKIAHCDIKPQNILVLNQKNLAMKLCDVGSCRVITNDSVQEATVFGTVPFLAPELVKTKSNKMISSNVFKSDVFSFGLVVLYIIIFKKFSSKERIQISEQAYAEVISEWVKEAREIIAYDSRITQVLRGALQFQEFKRPLFKDVRNVYEQEKKKKAIAHDAKIKKLEDQQNQKKMKMQQNFMSIPTTKISLFKTRNINTKITTRTTSIGFPKISRNYDRNISPGQLSPGLSPLLSKRQSSCFGSPQKINSSILDFKKVIYVTEQDKEAIPFQFLNQEQKNFVFLTNGVSIKKADCISFYQPCTLAAIYEIAEVEANKLYLEYQKFEGIGVGSDCPTLKIKKIYANFSYAELVGGYKNLFRSFCGNELQSLEIVMTGSDACFADLNDLLDRLSGKSLKYLGIIWQNNLMSPQEHSLITQKASRLIIKKLALVMNQNFIKYEKQARFLLPKHCQTLYLQYKSNFMGKLVSNLSISILNSPIKQLYLNFSNNNLNKSQSNMLFKSISSIQTLQKLILNLSWNPIQDISYIISSLNSLKQVSSMELKLHHAGIPEGQIFEAVGSIKYLFDRNLRILKVGYDRNMRRQEFVDRIEMALEGFKCLKVDVIGYDNKYFMAFIKKTSKGSKSKASTGKMKGQKNNLIGFKSMQQQKDPKPKPGNCQSLFTNNLSYENYLCLACSEFSQLGKTQHFCKYCIENCKHKGHNIVKIYERVKCCCAYSGCCASEVAKKVCAEDLKIRVKKEYHCYKCARRYCQGCVGRCMDGHRGWVDENKELVVFECKTYI